MDKETMSNDMPKPSEIDKAKLAVIQSAFGICSLSEPELYECLEKLYWLGFKAGHEFVTQASDKKVLKAAMSWFQENGFGSDPDKPNLSVRTRLSAVSGALRRIMKSTPHSMCADAEAWALGEAALASIGEGVGS